MIRIQNIYHMLAYAFRVLDTKGYDDVATEEFDNTADLCAEILARGISSQLKRGLEREYLNRTEALSCPRGKIEISDSIKTRSLMRLQLVCSHDEFSVDTQMNRVLKATCKKLIGLDIAKSRKKELKQLLVFFDEVSDINLATVDWHMRFDRNSQTYRMLMNVCWLVVEGLLQTQSGGTMRLLNIFDNQRMYQLYEKFILEYYRREHPELTANASYIGWVLDDETDNMLPAMKSDIMLSRGNEVLIIDAKYYEHTTQMQFGTPSVHSGNLYQIFAYVKNKEAELTRAGVQHRVSGMLLYARTDEDVQPDVSYSVSGNMISVRTLDLDVPFEEIRSQLDGIAEEFFGEGQVA